ncbi:MAG: hypothetical protein KF851_09525 [Pirellulaceae bacterium]|nr:hypothetical protein [Pirellulaceae bacterium]
MKEPSKEDLLGFMLGALDAEEQKQVQQAVDRQPDLENELLTLKGTLAPLELIDRPAGPPPGLARRTCQLIAMATRTLEDIPSRTNSTSRDLAASRPGSSLFDEVLATETATAPPTNSAQSAAPRLSPKRSTERWLAPAISFSDFVVGVLAVTVLSSLLFPAILSSRHQQRVAHCQQNLGDIYQAFATYSNTHQRDMIPIPTSGPLSAAGVFAPFLKDQGLVNSSSTFACPGLGENLTCEIPSCEQILNTPCEIKRKKFCERMSGDYGLSLGHLQDGRYMSPRLTTTVNAVLIADAPGIDSPNYMTRNHDGKGANCLLRDGSIVFVVGGVYVEDSIYVNDLGVVGAGLHEGDAVIAGCNIPFPNSQTDIVE